jgi:acetyl-CoA carboxylase carboxyl transferase subunit beta
MSISDWFLARETRRYTRSGGEKSPVPETDAAAVHIKCEECHQALDETDLLGNARVCPHCGHHYPVPALERIEMLVDEGSFVQTEADLVGADPLEFCAAKPYTQSLASAREKSGLNEAVLTGRATIGGTPVVLGVMDFRFIGASMGSVVGEKIARAFDLARAEELPVVLVIASGGARMQEGMLSLMQMAKTSAAVRRHSDAGLAYVSVLTNPTYGGVTASFAMLADVLVAEPGAMIGFAGPRLVEQTIRQKLPKGFQTAESMLKHGMIDEIIERRGLKDHLTMLLGYLSPGADRGVA